MLVLASAIVASLMSRAENQGVMAQAALTFDNAAELSVRDFAIQQGHGRFLIAADTPAALRLGLRFAKSNSVKLHIRPSYPDWVCTQGRGGALLRVYADRINEETELVAGQIYEYSLDVYQNEVVRVALENSEEPGCGRAEVYVYRELASAKAIITFIAIWLLLFLLFGFTNSHLSYAIVGLAINVGLVYANSTLEVLTPEVLFSSTALALALSGLLLLLDGAPFRKFRQLFCLLLLALMLVWLSFFIIHYLFYGVPVEPSSVHAFLQSNTAELFEFLWYQFGWFWILGVLAVFASLYGFHRFLDQQTVGGQHHALGIALLLPALVAAPWSVAESPTLRLLKSSTQQYFHELRVFTSLKDTRQATIPNLSLTRPGQKVVVVIGESANRNHMSLYGYPRVTTPEAQRLYDAGELIKFKSAYSSHTFTQVVLPDSLTAANQYNEQEWVTSASLMSVANILGVDTAWISNQQMLGVWDNQVAVLAQEAGTLANTNKMIGAANEAINYDEVVLPQLERLLRSDESAQLIFVHIQGSHFSYCKRVPEGSGAWFGKYAERADYGFLASSIRGNNNRSINCYDDSIAYTDQVLAGIVKILDATEHAAAMLYFADHSEDVINNKGHNASDFTFAMTEIPMLFWANPSWRSENPDLWSAALANHTQVFTNVLIYESVLQLLGVTGPHLELSNSVFSSSYEVPEPPKTLLGKLDISAQDNWRYWQQKNILGLTNEDTCTRLLPHRLNSIGAAKSSLNDGVCGFEVDVVPERSEAGFRLSVGHDQDSLAEITLEEFLSALPLAGVKKIWLDVKASPDSGSVAEILRRLDALDEKFQLKQRAIIEISGANAEHRVLSDAGFHVSLYLTAQDFADLQEAQSRTTDRISGLIDQVNPAALSFNSIYYPLVKSLLEPAIADSSLTYHSWALEGTNFAAPEFSAEIKQNELYQDDQVATILIKYVTPYRL